MVEKAPNMLIITTPIHLELVRIPAGEFPMGSDPAKDKDGKDDEQPQHKVYLNEYSIGKYPVTNQQYAVFKGDIRFPKKKRRHPVIVNWHDAVVFCDWLTKETGQPFRLPTEAEWEKAARGTDGRIYPWGDDFDQRRCNTSESGKKGTTPVDYYREKGASPYGAWDMAGNVWEWCSSLWGKDLYNPDFRYPYDPQDGREDLNVPQDVLRVLRGGSFSYLRGDVRCAVRLGRAPVYRYDGFGFRVVCGAPPVSHPGS